MKESNLKQEPTFMVVLLGIIFDPKERKILIVKRKPDKYIKELTWNFPGGKVNPDKKLEDSLKKEIKEKTGYNIEILGSIFSRIFPEKKDLILLYYLCEATGGKEKIGGSSEELKWVKPKELRKYFTTSFDQVLEEYINNLE